MNFNEIFRKDVANDNIKGHKKVRFYAVCKKHTFGSQGCQFYANLFRVNVAVG